MARHAGTDQDLLAMALVGYEAAMAKIDEAIREIQAKLGHGVKAATDGVAPARRPKSASARRRIAAAQRKRWAAFRRAKAKPQRKLSAAARKRIGDAARKRWAAVRKAAAQKGATATAS